MVHHRSSKLHRVMAVPILAEEHKVPDRALHLVVHKDVIQNDHPGVFLRIAVRVVTNDELNLIGRRRENRAELHEAHLRPLVEEHPEGAVVVHPLPHPRQKYLQTGHPRRVKVREDPFEFLASYCSGDRRWPNALLRDSGIRWL